MRFADIVKPVLFFGAMTAIAAFLIVRTVGQYRDRQRKFRHWPKASATVVRYERESGGRYNLGSVVCVYRYDVNGGQANGRGPNIAQGMSWPPSPPPGSTVEIAYNPNDVEEVVSRKDARLPPGLLGFLLLPVLVVLGTACMLIAAVVRAAR